MALLSDGLHTGGSAVSVRLLFGWAGRCFNYCLFFGITE